MTNVSTTLICLLLLIQQCLDASECGSTFNIYCNSCDNQRNCFDHNVSLPKIGSENNSPNSCVCPALQCPACVCECNCISNIGTDSGNNGAAHGNNGTVSGNNGTGNCNSGIGNGGGDTGSGNSGTGTGNKCEESGNNDTVSGNSGTGSGNNGTETGNNCTECGNNGTSQYDPVTGPCTKCCSYCDHLTFQVLDKNTTINGTVFANLASALTYFMVKFVTTKVLPLFIEAFGANGNQSLADYIESQYGEARGEYNNCTYGLFCSLAGVIASNTVGFSKDYTAVFEKATDMLIASNITDMH